MASYNFTEEQKITDAGKQTTKRPNFDVFRFPIYTIENMIQYIFFP